jgi:transcriptional regulator with XRE-family HTH domain
MTIGELITAEREKRGWDQRALAKTVGVRQQTVSRWESSQSRPRQDDVAKLALIFKVEVEEWLLAAGYHNDHPTAPLEKSLPLHRLSETDFELFCVALVECIEDAGAEVHRYGTKGSRQKGIDIYAKKMDGKKNDYQCKRHAQFGPADAKKAVEDTTFESEHHHLLLSRTATPELLDEMDTHDDWSVWDVEDIARKIRRLPKDDQLRLVDTYFRHHRKDFLAMDEPSPWLEANKIYAHQLDRRRIFNHGWTMAGRQKELALLLDFTKAEDAPQRVFLLSGRGGVGKSRLLLAFAEEAGKFTKVLFLQTGVEVRPKDFEDLPEIGVVVIDDAHERTDILPLLNGLLQKPGLKVVIGTRPYGLTRVQDELARSGADYGDGATELNDLSEDAAQALAEEILTANQASTEHAKQIAKITKDLPLATVIGSRLVAEGKITPAVLNNSDKFRSYLLSTFRTIVEGEIGGVAGADDIRRLLDLISVIQPISLKDEAFRHAAAELLHRQINDVLRDIHALEDAGVLITRSRMTRVAPDLLADFIRAQASYNERLKEPTGYVEQVFSMVDGELATNLLVNISQLDWRLSGTGTQSELLDEAWQRVEKQFLADGIQERAQLLKALAQVGYYQPERAIKFARLALDNPIEISGEERKHRYHLDYSYVLGEVAPMLRYAAYNISHVIQAVRLLKELGKLDGRVPRQNSDHPIRILQDLAGIEPGKPTGFNKMVADEVVTWLDEPYNAHRSPLDILDGLLSTEGYESESDNLKLTLRPYKVIAENVAPLRKIATDAAFSEARKPDIKRAIRGVQTLGEALNYPWGQDVTNEDRAKWDPQVTRVMAGLEELVADTQLDPLISVEVRAIVGMHAGRRSSPTKAAAEKVLAAVPTTIEYELTRALADNWGRTFENDAARWEENQSELIAWRTKLAEKLISENESDFAKLISHLENRVKVISSSGGAAGQNDAGPLIGALGETSMEFARQLGEYLLINPSSTLNGLFGVVVTALNEHDYATAIDFAGRGVASDSLDLMAGVSRALGWSLSRTPVTSSEFEIIRAIAKSKNEWCRRNIVRAAKRFEPKDKPVAVSALMSINIEDSKEVADELLGEFVEPHGSLKIQDISEEQLKTLMAQLVKCPSIDGHYIGLFLHELSYIKPERVVQLLRDRVEYREQHDDELEFNEYDTLPHMWISKRPPFRFYETSAYEELLRGTREWALSQTKSYNRAHYGPKVFEFVSAGYDEATLTVLREWIVSPDQHKLETAANLLREAGKDFIWDNHAYVATALEQAQKHGDECYKHVSTSLASPVIFGSRNGAVGEPYPEDITQRDKSAKLMNEYRVGTAAYKFFKMLNDAARESIARHAEEDAELT